MKIKKQITIINQELIKQETNTQIENEQQVKTKINNSVSLNQVQKQQAGIQINTKLDSQKQQIFLPQQNQGLYLQKELKSLNLIKDQHPKVQQSQTKYFDELEFEEKEYEYQSEVIFLLPDMLELIQFQNSLVTQVPVNTKTSYFFLTNLVEGLVTQICKLLQKSISNKKLQPFYQKLLSLLYCLSYNCKAAKQQNIVKMIISCLQKVILKTEYLDHQRFLQILVDILLTDQFKPQESSLIKFQIIINDQQKSRLLTPSYLSNYLIQFREPQLIDSYLFLRKCFVPICSTNYEVAEFKYQHIHNIKKLINFSIFSKFLTYSQRKQFISILTQLSALELKLDQASRESVVEGLYNQILEIKRLIINWIQNKCKFAQYYQNYQEIFRGLNCYL